MTFETLFSAAELNTIVSEVATRINNDYEARDPLFVIVLNGAFFFAADLLKKVTVPCSMSFVRLKSYTGTATSGELRELVSLVDDITNRDIVVIEDIVDTGLTMHWFKLHLLEKGAASVKVVSLLYKPDSLQYEDAQPDYIGRIIPKKFVIGYGFDLDEQARNLDAVYALKQ